MQVFGFELLAEDKVNAVKLVRPGWVKVNMVTYFENRLFSIARWEKPSVPFYQVSDLQYIHQQSGGLPYRINGHQKKVANGLVIYENTLGLIHFLQQSLETTNLGNHFDRKLLAFIKEKDIKPANLNMIEELITQYQATEEIVRGGPPAPEEILAEKAKTNYGFIPQDEWEHISISIQGQTWLFPKHCYPQNQIILREDIYKCGKMKVPVSQALCCFQFFDNVPGPCVSLIGGRQHIYDNLSELDPNTLVLLEKGKAFAWTPFFPIEDDWLCPKILIRLPSALEAMNWVNDGGAKSLPSKVLEGYLEKTKALPEAWRDVISRLDLPEELPAAGYIKDTRSLFELPKELPLVDHPGEVLAILARNHAGTFIASRPPRPSFYGLNLQHPLWAVIATPKPLLSV